MECRRICQNLLPVSAGMTILFSTLSAPLKANNQPLQVRSSMAMYLLGSYQRPVDDSPANPDNSILGLEGQSLSFDVRPSIKADSGQFQLIARPQFKTSLSRIKKGDTENSEHPETKAKWLESYGILNASDKILVSYGLQNYQWGAAESLNPSNRIFHENIDSKGVLSAVQGKNIFRVNFSWTKHLSSILMSETEKARDASEFRSGEEFETRTLMKHEMNWNSGADYVGVVYGAQEKGGPWFGEYFNLSLFDGLTLYGDASHGRNSEAWYPVVERSAQVPTANIVQMRQSELTGNKFFTMAVGGLRYGFVGGSDLRFEYILNSAGWTREDSQRAVLALNRSNQLQLPDFETNLKRILKPGLEYRGQKYGMVSLRVPDAFDFRDLTIYGRYLRSLTDGSSSIYGSMEYAFWSASTFVLSGFTTTGKADTELRGVVASNITAGIRQDF
jgi:hypothetical protein